jgi:RNA polymerase sigma-70 factor, ECF subfamily
MDLPERFAAGGLEAFERMFREYQPEVRRWLVRLVRDQAAADELTIDVFWRIYRARARFDPSRSFVAWARRIASNAAIDYLRRTRISPFTG